MHCRRLHRVLFLAWAVLALVGVGCSTNAPPHPLADGGVERQLVGASGPGPSDSGIPHVRGGLTQPVASAVDIRSAPDFYPSLVDAGAGYYVVGIDDAGDAAWSQLTTDLINGLPAAFTESLAFASGSGSYELSQPATPTYNATPATNDATVTGCTIADNQGHSASAISRANAINVDSPSGPHSYALTSAGNVTVTVTCTKISTSTTKSGSATLSYFTRGGWHGVDSHSGGNTITASSSNVTLGGGSATATLTGSSLVSSFVGTSFTDSPSSQYIYAAYPHTGSAHTFTAGGFFFPMSVVVASFSFTNQWGQTSIPVDIYRSDNLLNATFVVVVTS